MLCNLLGHIGGDGWWDCLTSDAPVCSQCRSFNGIGPDGATALAAHLKGLTCLCSLKLNESRYLDKKKKALFESHVCMSER